MDLPFDPRPLLDSCVSLARSAAHRGDAPVGAVAVDDRGAIHEQASDRQWSRADVTAHAERLLLSDIAAGRRRPSDLWVVSNVEPCSMCASALVKAKVRGIVYGAPTDDAMDPQLPLTAVLAASRHRPVVVGPVDPGRHATAIREGRAESRKVRQARWAGVTEVT